MGQGSRFHFLIHLDVASAEPEVPVPPEPACLHGLRVLVVDDNATNRRILDEVLHGWQMTVGAAASAAEAIQQLREAKQNGNPYRLVLTDAHMPYVDGFMLARQIKCDPLLDSTIVMMLTSGDRSEDTQRCRELGIVAYLLKPIKQSELLEAIEMALGIGAARPQAAPPVNWKWTRNLRILLAEDSLINQKLAVALLGQQGHAVKVAGNGREAVAYAAAETFDLILMDVQMPEMDGLEATAKIRDWERHADRHIPIIAVTAHALKGDRERCLEAGTDDYIAKPLRAEELFEAIAAQVPDAIEPRSIEPTAPPHSVLPSFVDWAESLRVVMGDRELLDTVVEAALEEVPCLMARLGEAIAQGDAAALRLAAHTLEGSLRYFGKTPVFDHAIHLEQLAKDQNLAAARSLWTELQGEVAEVLQLLHNYSHVNNISRR